MSLINDMLRDLDRRRVGIGKTSSLAPVPSSRRGILIILAMVMLGGGVLVFAAYLLGRNGIPRQVPHRAVYQSQTETTTPSVPRRLFPRVGRSNLPGVTELPTLLVVTPSPQGAARSGLWLSFSAPLAAFPLPQDNRTLRVRLAARLPGHLPALPLTVGIASLQFTKTRDGMLLVARAKTGFRLRLDTVPGVQPAPSILVLQAYPITATAPQIYRRQAGRASLLKRPPHGRVREINAPSFTSLPAPRHITQRVGSPRPIARSSQRTIQPARSLQKHSSPTPEGKPTGGKVTVRPQPVSPTVRAHRAYNRAMQELAAGHASLGHTALLRALEIDPRLIPARLMLAGLEAKDGRIQSALALLDTGLTLQPNHSGRLSLVRLKARILIDAGHTDRALEVLKKNTPPVSADPGYHALLAGLEVQAGHYRRAAHQYAALLVVNPDRAVWWLGLGIALDQSRQDRAALRAYQNALQHPGLSSAATTYARRRLKALGRRKP